MKIRDALLTIASELDRATEEVVGLAEGKISRLEAINRLRKTQARVISLSYEIERNLFDRSIPVYSREDKQELAFYMRKYLDVLIVLAVMSNDTNLYKDSVIAINRTRRVVTQAVRDLYEDVDRIPGRVKEVRDSEQAMHEMFLKHRIQTYSGEKLDIFREVMRAMETLKEVMLRVFVIAVKIKG